ncbi:NUDIX hydrolase [Lactococcus nasutitermitis]|uniref:NUDIX hydrolase n=1 Tax=Lactococcus nasutitermitis TaxID=1652957 RepID=A0ABV9JER6_9LACT|nr:NUDIX domain-containing protein [Lactococcus nasutitermitis]
MNNDIGFSRENNWFRYRAGAIIVEDGKVLMAHNNHDDYFYSVGGAVQFGETAEEACQREVFEETGLHFEIERLAFIHENFFVGQEIDEMYGKHCHELTFYFLMKPIVNPEFHISETHLGWQEKMVWLPLETYSTLKAFPTFFADELPHLTENLKHIITYENWEK